MSDKEVVKPVSVETLEKRYQKRKTAFITAMFAAAIILLVDVFFIESESNIELAGFMGTFLGIAFFYNRRMHIAKRAWINNKEVS